MTAILDRRHWGKYNKSLGAILSAHSQTFTSTCELGLPKPRGSNRKDLQWWWKSLWIGSSLAIVVLATKVCIQLDVNTLGIINMKRLGAA